MKHVPSEPLPKEDLEASVDDVGMLWNKLAGKRLLITGGTGMFGAWMIESLFAAKRRIGLEVEVVALSRDPEAFSQRRPHLAGQESLRILSGTLDSLDLKERFDLVIHMATEADLRATLAHPCSAIDVIADSARRALEFGVKAGATRFLLTSSGSVYARKFAKEPIDEDFAYAPDPTDVSDANAISGCAKRQAEAWCAAVSKEYGLGATIARCFAFLAPGLPLDGKFAAGNFVRDALAGGPIRIQGDGSPVRSYLYGSDLATWLWTILLEGRPGRAYNVGSEHALTLRELARLTAQEIAPGGGVQVAGLPDPQRCGDYYVPSTARARIELGLSERINIVSAIRKTAAWAALKR